jgi:hypothetical protein
VATYYSSTGRQAIIPSTNQKKKYPRSANSPVKLLK